jgi:hypothetical protein
MGMQQREYLENSGTFCLGLGCLNDLPGPKFDPRGLKSSPERNGGMASFQADVGGAA